MADYTVSSGNVFKDMGLPSPEEKLAKAKLAWQDALGKKRLLILSPFESRYNRQTVTLANQRNAFVAALADKICIAHAAEDSRTWNSHRW